MTGPLEAVITYVMLSNLGLNKSNINDHCCYYTIHTMYKLVRLAWLGDKLTKMFVPEPLKPVFPSLMHQHPLPTK